MTGPRDVQRKRRNVRRRRERGYPLARWLRFEYEKRRYQTDGAHIFDSVGVGFFWRVGRVVRFSFQGPL